MTLLALTDNAVQVSHSWRTKKKQAAISPTLTTDVAVAQRGDAPATKIACVMDVWTTGLSRKSTIQVTIVSSPKSMDF